MSMHSQHIVEEMVFDVSFSTEDAAFAEQAALSGYVSDALVREVDGVFNGYSNDTSILRIERLEVDLGVVALNDYQSELTERLKRRLREQLDEYKARSTVKDSIGVVSLQAVASDLETLQFYIRYGYLPWHCQIGSEKEMQSRFMRIVEFQCDELITLLESAGSLNTALDRLVDMLSDDVMLKIGRKLLRGNFIVIELLLAKLADYMLLHGGLNQIGTQSRRRCLLDVWKIAIAVLIDSRNRSIDVAFTIDKMLAVFSIQHVFQLDRFQEYLYEQKKTVGGSNSKELNVIIGAIDTNAGLNSKLSHDPVILSSTLINAINDNDGVVLQRLWKDLHYNKKIDVENIINSIMLHAIYRRKIIAQLSETTLYEWCAVIACDHAAYLQSCRAFFVVLMMTDGLPEKEARHDFWNYALLYLATFKPGQFERDKFLTGLCENVDGDLIKQVVSADAVLSIEGVNLQTVVGRLRLKKEEKVIGSQSDSRSVSVNLSDWISSGDASGLNTISKYWDSIYKTHSVLLTRLVRTHGRDVSIRRALARALSSAQLSEMIVLLDPDAKSFVVNSVAQFKNVPLWRNQASEAVSFNLNVSAGLRDEHRLWSFSLNFFLIERGSRFNKKEYCGSMLREMAAHNNYSYYELLIAMQQRFSSSAQDNPFSRELVSILSELCKESAHDYVMYRSDLNEVDDIDIAGNGSAKMRVHQLLENNQPINSEALTFLEQFFDDYLSRPSEEDNAYIRWLLGSEQRVRCIADHLTEVKLNKVLSITGGERHRTLYPCAELLVDALEKLVDKTCWLALRRDCLVFSSRYIFSGPRIKTGAFIRSLASYLIARSSLKTDVVIPMLVASFNHFEGASKHAEVLDAIIYLSLPSDEDGLQKQRNDIARLGANKSGNSADQLPLSDADLNTGMAVYIKNAGQVLLAPYLPTLFKRLGLIEGGAFVNSAASARAVHALQYMVDGVGDAPEYMMVLNKLICGVASAQPVVRNIQLNDDEKQLIDGLLVAVIEKWKGIGNTSVDGLRDSFLKREGRLYTKDDQWHLQIESRSYDMLLDSLPWSYATIKYSWMPRVIYVEWR